MGDKSDRSKKKLARSQKVTSEPSRRALGADVETDGTEPGSLRSSARERWATDWLCRWKWKEEAGPHPGRGKRVAKPS